MDTAAPCVGAAWSAAPCEKDGLCRYRFLKAARKLSWRLIPAAMRSGFSRPHPFQSDQQACGLVLSKNRITLLSPPQLSRQQRRLHATPILNANDFRCFQNKSAADARK